MHAHSAVAVHVRRGADQGTIRSEDREQFIDTDYAVGVDVGDAPAGGVGRAYRLLLAEVAGVARGALQAVWREQAFRAGVAVDVGAHEPAAAAAEVRSRARSRPPG